MSSERRVLPEKWMKLLCMVGTIYAVAVAAYIFTETGKPLGARDFHQFWYAGHFIIQERDPYEAFFAKEPPNLPVHYVDGVTINRYPVAQADLEITPSNTPAMLLMLTPFSYFSWETAKWLFLMINLVLTLATAWLALRHIPFAGVRLTPLEEFFILLVYFDFSATRIAIENGQTTLFVFLLMMVSLIFSKRAWYISGIALGLALSKYSLSIPIFLFFIYKREIRILLMAIIIQMIGILGVAEISRGTPAKIIVENIMLFFRLFDQPGVHLSRWFEFISDNHFLSIVPSLVMTVLVFIPIFTWTRRKKPATSSQEEVLDFHVLTILFIWTILVAYHRLYDTLILIFFVILIFKGLKVPRLWNLADGGRKALLAFMALTPLILILPARIVDLLLPFYYGRVSDGITTILLVIMLAISMFLLWRYLQNMQVKTIRKEAESDELRDDPYRDTQPRWAHHS
jgi:hypothetical protein